MIKANSILVILCHGPHHQAASFRIYSGGSGHCSRWRPSLGNRDTQGYFE